MREDARTVEVGWPPLRDSYEESVLTWYEQVENSFRRQEQESQPRIRERVAAAPGERAMAPRIVG